MEKVKQEDKNKGGTSGEKTAILLPPCKREDEEGRWITSVMGGCMYLYPYRPLIEFQRRLKIRIASSRVIRKYANWRTGRLSGLRIVLPTAPSRFPSGSKCGVRPLLQQRLACDGFEPSFLLTAPGSECPRTAPVIELLL